MNKVDSLLVSGHKFDELLSKYTESDPTKIVSFVNPFSYYLLLENDVLNDIDVLFSDGALHATLHRLLVAQDKFKRASFDYSSIACNTLRTAELKGYEVAIIGGDKSEIVKAKKNILKRYPLINISYERDGFFLTDTDYSGCFEHLESAKIVIVGMGTPLQEVVCSKIKNKYPAGKLIFTCGGFLTQTAIKSDYYHPIIKKCGLRWLQRAYMHKHVRRRLVKDYPAFIVKYILKHLF